MEIGDICDICFEPDCENCTLGNPCLGCDDYVNGECISMGACGGEKE